MLAGAARPALALGRRPRDRPAGRYRVDADTDSGSRRVVGLTPAEDAPFQIQALSTAGDVDVETP